MGFKKVFFFILFAAALLTFEKSMGQNSAVPQNFSNVKVDDLSDDQVLAFMRQLESTGMGDGQLEQVAAARGMRQEEIPKLRARVNKLKKSNGKNTQFDTQKNTDQGSGRDSSTNTTDEGLSAAEKQDKLLRSRIFGAILFKNTDLTFQPNLRLATPNNYIIGPDDEITVDITGDNEATYKLKVSPEGTIRVEYAGIIAVTGLSIEQATQKIRSRLMATYPGIREGRTDVTVGIGNIRSIQVTIIGEAVKPGTYTLPSLATVFNALYASGGPTSNGSFRTIEVIRNNSLIATLDIYDFLLKGIQKNNVQLRDQDVIHIPTYNLRVEFTGEVKRPLIFEVKPNETLTDVLNFAGGFNDKAYTSRIKILQNTDQEKRIQDISAAEYNTYKPKRGDRYYVEPILERFTNRVSVKGAVMRPGAFELTKGLTLGGLIKKAEGIKEDAFLSRGYITRLRADYTSELISFDLGRILQGTDTDIPLQREDIVTISSIFDLREEYKVAIDGEVREPGTFDYSENMSLEDLILRAGGLKEGASAKRIEISRRVKNSDVLSTSAATAEVFQVDVTKDLKFSVGKFILQPFDIVSVRNAVGYETQRQVWIDGEVLYPGKYTVIRKNERLSDLIIRAGGLTPLAYPTGASLRRIIEASKVNGTVKKDNTFNNDVNNNDDGYNNTGNNNGTNNNGNNNGTNNNGTNNTQNNQGSTGNRNNFNDTTNTSRKKVNEPIPHGYVGIDLVKIMANPGTIYDLILEEGDSLHVPKQLQTIKVNGEVRSPITIIYDADKGFKEYVYEAGGYTERALRKRAYILYANGAVKSTRKFLFFNNYPKVQPGAEIYIPTADVKRKISAAELVGIGTGLATLALLLINLTKL